MQDQKKPPLKEERLPRPPRKDITGLMVINKPKGWTSFDVVAKLRNKLGAKKVGHTGTLDPMATGVLVLCLGQATRLAEKMVALEKEYVGEITLGAVSNTDDADGEIVPNKEAGKKSRIEVERALKAFEGEIEQMPPDFSAKKVDGKRAYALARKGKPVELKAAKVTIYELEVLGYEWPRVTVRVKCSKGTYIRSLARDLGQALGVGGYLSALERTKVGNYSVEQAVSVEEASEEKLIKVPQAQLMKLKPTNSQKPFRRR